MSSVSYIVFDIVVLKELLINLFNLILLSKLDLFPKLMHNAINDATGQNKSPCKTNPTQSLVISEKIFMEKSSGIVELIVNRREMTLVRIELEDCHEECQTPVGHTFQTRRETQFLGIFSVRFQLLF